jgi:hypothetical protein
VTAGLRGTEATESELKTYWRGDERQVLENAQSLAQANPGGALGERQRAAAGFQEFLKRDPRHALARDAEQALAALR